MRYLAIIFSVIALPLLAANHYVQTGAAGSRSGNDWANAYTNLPASLTRGDTYYIGNGTYPAWLLNDSESGTSYITVKKATVADHGTDTGWSAGYASQATLGNGLELWRGFYKVLGAYSTTQTDPTSYGFLIAKPSNCAADQHFISIGPGGSTVSNIFMSDIAAIACANDVEKFLIYSQTTTTHANYGFTNIYSDGFQSAVSALGWQGGFLERWFITNSFSSGSHHGATINVRNGPGGPTRNLHLKNSIIIGFPTPAVEGNDGGSDEHVADGLYIYGNVFAEGTAGLGVLACTTRSSWSHVFVANNTFNNCDNGWFGAAQSGSSTAVKNACTNNVATNNIVANMAANLNDYSTTGIAHNYNMFVSATSIPSESAGVTTTSDPFVNVGGYNFRLTGATTAGATLEAIYNVDMDGVTRTTPDRGAFEYDAGGSVPTISSNNAAGTNGQVFLYQISATQSPTGYGATNLPTGLYVTNATGYIGGTPLSAAGQTNSAGLFATNSTGAGTPVVVVFSIQQTNAAASQTNFYVSTTGSDSAAGTIGAPFLTLNKAKAMATNSGSIVYVRGGTYYLTSPLALGSTNSGTTWIAYPNETPILVGGLPITNWTTYSGSIMVADVSTQGLSGVNFRQLINTGHRQRLARYPNFDSSNPIRGGWLTVETNVPVNTTTEFIYSPGSIPQAWANPEQVEVFIYPTYRWWNFILNVTNINTGTRTVQSRQEAIFGISKGDYYYFQNVFEELDAPGEWFLNTNTSRLYFYPSNTITASTPIIAPVTENLVTIAAGSSNIVFKGFELLACAGTGLTVTNATNCIIAKNLIHDLGGYDAANYLGSSGSGVIVAGGWSNGVIGNDISFVGRCGIVLEGGTDTNLAAAANYADNNYIHHTGIDYKEGVGILIGGVGNRATHNYITEVPRMGIRFAGQNHLLEYNSIYRAMLETDDGGSIYAYSSADWKGSYGTSVRFNYVNESPGFGFNGGITNIPSLSYCLYLDGLTCGVDVVGNIFTRSSSSGVFINGGSFNVVSNNIISDCTHPAGGAMHYSPQLIFKGYPTNSSTWQNSSNAMRVGYNSVAGYAAWAGFRGVGFSPTNYVHGTAGYTIHTNIFQNNIWNYPNTPNTPWAYYGYNVGYDRNSWRSNVLYRAGGTITPIYTNSNAVTWADWQTMGQDAGSITTDPLLSTNTWQVAAESPALTVGFQQIPFSSIGVYNDPLRASWPLVAGPKTLRVGTMRAGNVYLRP